MVYDTDAMFPVEIDTPTWRRDNFSEEGIAVSMDIIDEIREHAHIREFFAKQRAARHYNSRVIPREMKEGDLVLKQVVALQGLGSYSQIEKDLIESRKNFPMAPPNYIT